MTEQTQYGFYLDTTKCTGCKACHISCKDRQGDIIRKTNPIEQGVPALEGINWRRVYEYGGGSWSTNADGSFEQNIFAYYTSIGGLAGIREISHIMMTKNMFFMKFIISPFTHFQTDAPSTVCFIWEQT